MNLQEANTAKKSYNQARWGLHFEALTGEDPRHEGLRGSLPEPGQMGGARAQNFKVSIAKPFVHNFVPELCPKLWQMSVYFEGSLNSFSFFLYFFRLPVALSLSLPRSPSISLSLWPPRALCLPGCDARPGASVDQCCVHVSSAIVTSLLLASPTSRSQCREDLPKLARAAST